LGVTHAATAVRVGFEAGFVGAAPPGTPCADAPVPAGALRDDPGPLNCPFDEPGKPVVVYWPDPPPPPDPWGEKLAPDGFEMPAGPWGETVAAFGLRW
jgi:hypothetical protein